MNSRRLLDDLQIWLDSVKNYARKSNIPQGLRITHLSRDADGVTLQFNVKTEDHGVLGAYGGAGEEGQGARDALADKLFAATDEPTYRGLSAVAASIHALGPTKYWEGDDLRRLHISAENDRIHIRGPFKEIKHVLEKLYSAAASETFLLKPVYMNMETGAIRMPETRKKPPATSQALKQLEEYLTIGKTIAARSDIMPAFGRGFNR